MKDIREALPASWAIATLEEVGEVVSGGTPSTKDPANFDGDIAWVTPADLSDHKEKVISRGRRNLSEQGLKSCSARLMPRGSVLFSSRAPIGYVAIADNELATNQGFKSVVPAKGVDESYLYFWLKSAKRIAERQASGTTFKEISGSRFSKLPIPVASLEEQRRIVEKIETLFVEMDKGEESLRQVQTLLARYRQSVLKAAVSGELTADWRAEREGKIEHGHELLERISTARREAWQRRRRYTEPVATDTQDLPRLPVGWTWASIDALAVEMQIGLVRSVAQQTLGGDGTKYLKMDRVNTVGELDLDTDVRVSVSEAEIDRYSLRRGDVLFNTRNSLELVGKNGIVAAEPSEPVVFNNNLTRIRFVGELKPEFANYSMCSPVFRKELQRVKRATTSVAAVYAGDLKTLPIAVAPVDEQVEISARISEELAKVRAVIAGCASEVARCGALRHSILKDAFSGRLVPQDPNDEPASELLARIRAARDDRKNK